MKLIEDATAITAIESGSCSREEKEKQITLSLAHTFAQSIREFMAREKKAIIILALLCADLFR